MLLDEIGDISPALQVRLLRLLQEKVYEPLGGTKSIKADVRVLAATNRNMEELVEAGTFRKDLYYRINVVRLTIPPLRERKEDIPLLIEHFIEHFNKLHGRNIEGISDAAMACLIHHDYPGNVRELENAIEHAFVLCRGEMIFPEHLPARFRKDTVEKITQGREGLTLQEIEALAITEALRRTGGNKVEAANDLGIQRSTLYRKIKEYRITVANKDK